MKQTISIVLIFLLTMPVSAFAAPPEETPTPKITGIEKGQEAPYSGVLLNPVAAAKIFAEKDYSLTECDLKIKYAVDKEIARCTLLLDSTRASLTSLQTRHDALMNIKNKEIERLSKIASERPNDYSTWWATGGVVVGIGLTLLVVYAVKEI